MQGIVHHCHWGLSQRNSGFEQGTVPSLLGSSADGYFEELHSYELQRNSQISKITVYVPLCPPLEMDWFPVGWWHLLGCHCPYSIWDLPPQQWFRCLLPLGQPGSFYGTIKQLCGISTLPSSSDVLTSRIKDGDCRPRWTHRKHFQVE